MSEKFTILYVEDEQQIRERVARLLGRFCEEIFVAEDGQDGLEKFLANTPSIVVTDIRMPRMSGLEMIAKIREVDTKVPIMLTTAHNEADMMLEAINLGVTQFLIKPVDVEKLIIAVGKCKEIAQIGLLHKQLAAKNDELQDAYNELNQAKEAQSELFHYKERYHTLQEETAFKKQKKIIRDELSHISANGVFFDIFYKPLDILSGDTYGTIDIGDGKYMIYIVDAMGKGLSASVTAIQSTSFINNAVENAILKNDFCLHSAIDSFSRYIKKQLLSDELLCAVFVLYDAKTDKLSIANFGMPPVLLLKYDGQVDEIRTNNLPIMSFFSGLSIAEVDFAPYKKAMLYSDGVNESPMIEGGCYQNELLSDFASSTTPREFIQKLVLKISSFDDDVTLASISKLPSPESTKKFTIHTSIDESSAVEKQIEAFLVEHGYETKSIAELLVVFTEMMVNAIEHGNLSVTGDQKEALMAAEEYELYLLRQLAIEENFKKTINIELLQYEDVEKWSEKGDKYTLFALKISDEGVGFGVVEALAGIEHYHQRGYHGRGIEMTNTLVDAFYYNSAGNQSTIFKLIKKG